MDIYLREVGIDSTKHQVAVFRHRDTDHDHVHIYANRVAMDGGPALKTGWNYKANVKASRQIEQELGLPPLTADSVRTRLTDHVPAKQLSREVVAEAIKAVLKHDKPTNLDELASKLSKHQVAARIAPNDKGISFKAAGHQPVKGTEVGYKFNQLAALLEANRVQYEAAKQPAPAQARKHMAAEKVQAFLLTKDIPINTAQAERLLAGKPLVLSHLGKGVQLVNGVIQFGPIALKPTVGQRMPATAPVADTTPITAASAASVGSNEGDAPAKPAKPAPKPSTAAPVAAAAVGKHPGTPTTPIASTKGGTPAKGNDPSTPSIAVEEPTWYADLRHKLTKSNALRTLPTNGYGVEKIEKHGKVVDYKFTKYGTINGKAESVLLSKLNAGQALEQTSKQEQKLGR